MRILVSLLLFVGILDGALAFAPCRPTTARSSVVQRHMARFPQDNDGISLASYLIMSFGAAVSFGFILNMVGLSYQFSWDHGVEVETIGKMREMNQFRAEVNHRPPSMLPK